ncbi:hypothetical protein TIFTF001_018409 [Ficus carica]|uniref:Uncharacterized protein n=1 Tax=Ficus carica TaxID=3494 RepID=A0AA88A9N7_FICCA|nr:hypothetical protein TIFTF001_018409 [Ficus carica]
MQKQFYEAKGKRKFEDLSISVKNREGNSAAIKVGKSNRPQHHQQAITVLLPKRTDYSRHDQQNPTSWPSVNEE